MESFSRSGVKGSSVGDAINKKRVAPHDKPPREKAFGTIAMSDSPHHPWQTTRIRAWRAWCTFAVSNPGNAIVMQVQEVSKDSTGINMVSLSLIFLIPE
ncbi:hypothetical protein SAMN05216315_12825 [Nitrosospira sp. Nsp18]|uniref:hypothetical protein n=1 Tax=Nitrosospira sp. Nsp18 TaxID=1855334 RepID=UPI0008835A1E|nr:hypothetical protein [Nitrosospira sp. Nsp18]SDA25766.1 hypothetical protein SAMN05216315_12825 [Nitrosospira sp. Nsp18]